MEFKCRRYTAKGRGEYQSYFTDSPYRVIDGETKCDYFIKLVEHEESNTGGIESNGLDTTEKTE